MATSVLRREFAEAFKKILQTIKKNTKENIPDILERVATAIDVSEDTLRGWYYKGNPPDYVQLRKLVRVLKHELERVLEQGEAIRQELLALLNASGVQYATGLYTSEILDELFPTPSLKRTPLTYEALENKRKFQNSSIDSQLTSYSLEPHVLFYPPKGNPFQATDEGREKVIRDIWLMVSNHNICAICGPPGFGKTATVTEVVWRLFPADMPAEKFPFPHGVFYHDFRGNPSVDQALEKLVRAFAPNIFDTEHPPTPEVAASLILAKRQPLLVFDSLENVDEYRKLSKIIGNCPRIIVSREALYETPESLVIDRITLGEAKQILWHWGKQWVGDDQIATQLCDVVDYMPLAVEIIGVQLSHFNLRSKRRRSGEDMLKELREARLHTLDFKQNPERSIRELFKHFVAQFDEVAGKTLPVIGLLAHAPFDQEVISKVLKLAPKQTEKALDRLVDYHWLDWKNGGIYELHHALMYDYSKEKAKEMDPSLLQEVMDRLIQYYLSKTQNHSELTREGFVWWDAERPHFLEILSACKKRQEWESAINLFHSIDAYLSFRGTWYERKEVLETALSSTQALQNRKSESAILIKLGGIYQDLGRYQTAITYFSQALAIYQETGGDRRLEADLLFMLSTSYAALHEYQMAIAASEQALTILQGVRDQPTTSIVVSNLGATDREALEHKIVYIRQALTLAQDRGDRRAEGRFLLFLGLMYGGLDEYQTGITYYQQALTIFQEIGDEQNIGQVVSGLGTVYYDLGEYQTAITYLQQALTIFQEIGSNQSIDEVLSKLGAVYHTLGEYQTAITYLRQALTLAQEVGNYTSTGQVLRELGAVYHALGEYQTAITYLQQALTLAQDRGDRRAEGRFLFMLGIAYSALEEYQTAIAYHRQALTIFQEVSDKQSVGQVMSKLGSIYHTLGEYQTGIMYLQQAVTIFQEVDDKPAIGTTLDLLGTAYDDLQEYQTAISYHRQALTIFQEVGDQKTTSAVLGNLGASYRELGEYQTAITYLRQALTLAQEVDDHITTGRVLEQLGAVNLDLGEYQTAITYLQQALTLAQEIGDRLTQGESLRRLGYVYYKQKEYNTAIKLSKESLTIFQTLRDSFRQEQILGFLPIIYVKQAHKYLNEEKFIEAQELYYQIIALNPDTPEDTAAYTGLGVIAYLYCNQEAVQHYFNMSLAKIVEMAFQCHQYFWFDFLQYKALAHLALGNSDDALYFIEQALDFRHSDQNFNLLFFQLLYQAPHPPSGIEKILDVINSCN